MILDEARLEANLEAVAAAVRDLGARLRPHIKTHKSREVLRRQQATGVEAVTAATVREAELAVDAGIRDVLIAYPPVGAARLHGIASLLDRARIVVACSELAHVEALRSLGRAVEYYWEVESGTGRLGSRAGEATADALERAAQIRGPQLAGLMTFGGHSYAAADAAQRRAAARREADALAESARAVRARGLEPGVLSSGATPLRDSPVGPATEYRFGNYAFLDATQVALGVATIDECALTVEATVVGRPTPDRVILDAGSKALAAERMSGATASFGLVRGHPELRIDRLYEEHAICLADGASELRLGDRVEIVPNHACTCANLHDAYVVRARDGGERRWTLDARGWGELGVGAA